ncbi:unnamed protein product [Staurois parvus]|uniref:Uncharacterized protein n=1 Tax=Staurois parvus TaxID=386267 RepID=A0ABN9DJ86_9NEOB|nr:unnamed protein product [Staurois parvus]
MTEQGQCMLKCTVRRNHQLSAESIAKDLQTSCGLQCIESFMEWFPWPNSCIQALHHQV